MTTEQPKRRRFKASMIGDVLVFVVMTALLVIWAVPFLWMLATAVKSPHDLAAHMSSWITLHPTLQNFKDAWNAAPFPQYYLNTILVVGGIVVAQFITATLAAYAFAKFNFPFRGLLFGLFLLQMMLPAPVMILPNFNTVSALHLVDTRLGIALPYIASAFGTFFLRQAFLQVPKDLDDAAKIDGCNPLQRLWYVYVPLIKPFYTAFGLVAVVAHWNEFLWPLIVTNTPASRVLTVGLASFSQYSEGAPQMATIAAGTLIVIGPLLVAFILFQRQFVESFVRTGIKG